MGIGTGGAALIGAGISAAGSIGGAAIGSGAAQSAASEQAQAAEQSAQLQYQASQNALNFQEQQYGQNQQNLQPWLQSGTGALGNLDYLLGISPQTSGQFQGAQNPTAPGALNPSTGGFQGSSGAPQYGNNPSIPASPYGAGNGQGSNPYSLNPGGTPGNPTNGTLSIPQGGFQSLPMQSGSQSGEVPGSGFQSSHPDIHATAGVSGNSGALGTIRPGQGGNGLTAGGINGQPAQQIQPGGGGSPASAGGYGSLLAPYPGQFTAPTAQQANQSPAEQAQLQLGEQALQQSAAAGGNLLTGGTAEALNSYAQNVAATNYQNVYNNAYNTYGANYNQYEQQQANEYNRLASIAGVGQTAAGQLGSLGQSASNNVSNNLLGTAQGMGQAYQNAAAANASGIVGSANAWGGALGNTGSSISNLLMLQQLGGMGSGATPSSGGGSGEDMLNYMSGGY